MTDDDLFSDEDLSLDHRMADAADKKLAEDVLARGGEGKDPYRDPDEESDESESETTPESSDSDPSVAAVLGYIDQQEQMKAASDAVFKQQLSSVSGEFSSHSEEPDLTPANDIEEAAVALAAMNDNDRNAFFAELKAANQKLIDEANGIDPDAPEPEPEVIPFSPAGLNTADFQTFMDAVAIGSADPSRVPAGETYDSWDAKVRSALVRSR